MRVCPNNPPSANVDSWMVGLLFVKLAADAFLLVVVLDIADADAEVVVTIDERGDDTVGDR